MGEREEREGWEYEGECGGGGSTDDWSLLAATG